MVISSEQGGTGGTAPDPSRAAPTPPSSPAKGSRPRLLAWREPGAKFRCGTGAGAGAGGHVTTVCSVWERRMTDSSAVPSQPESRPPPRVVNTVLAEALVDPRERG